VVIETPQERGHGPALGKTGFTAECPGGLAGGGRADEFVTGGGEGFGGTADGRGLPSAGNAQDK
jgi:hypothetical protein